MMVLCDCPACASAAQGRAPLQCDAVTPEATAHAIAAASSRVESAYTASDQELSRRGALALVGAAALIGLGARDALAQQQAQQGAPRTPSAQPQTARPQPPRGSVRRLVLYNTHTGETFSDVYRQGGQFHSANLRRLSHMLRDTRSGSVRRFDPRLFDILWVIQQRAGRGTIRVVSGYRSPETNYQLYLASSGGVAENSFHTRAMAIDFEIPGKSPRLLANIARAAGAGGVGRYGGSRFIHVDTGPRRNWIY